MQPITDQIADLIVFSETLPKDSHRYMWCEDRIRQLQYIKSNCTVRRNEVFGVIGRNSIKVSHKGIVYESINQCSIALEIDLTSLYRDIFQEKYYYEVYRVKNYKEV